MGWVSEDEIRNGLDGALRFFRKYIEMLDSLDECQIYVLIMVVGVYLYSKYCKISGRRKSDSYWIDASIMNIVYRDESLADMASSIVLSRNKIAHVPFGIDTDERVKSILKRADFKRLLIFEGVIDSDGKFIEPESGMYQPIDYVQEVDDKPDLLKAIAKMGGN